ncbi:MAG: hypothetical protein ACOX2N_00525 [Peptococcia bacterium]|jgi:hypothetical protein
MKKTRLLIATLVCAVMLMGIGYAWWNDAVTIGGTAGTGHMDVVFTTANVVGAEHIDAEAEPSSNGKEIECTFSNLYPGGVIEFSATVQNNSSIPVKFDGAKLTLSENAEEFKQFIEATVFDPEYYDIWLPIENFVGIMDLVKTEPDLSFMPELADMVPAKLEPNESKDVTIYLRLAEDAENDTEDQTFTLNVKFDWRQFNAPTPEPEV